MNVIVEREKSLMQLEERIADLRAHAQDQPVDFSSELGAFEAKYQQILQEIFGSLTPWQRVNMARHPKRPIASDYIAALDAFDELHGDRHFRDDPAIMCGFAKLRGRRVMIMAQEKGRDVKDKVKRNFGMVTPEGYRKVTRLVKLAEHLKLPIVTLIDTSGADPGIASEEHAQSEAIAMALYTFAEARTPVVATIIGEGGSGGALALGIADRVMMLENATYSVASPEGCAAILWGDASKADEAAERLKLTSADLLGFKIVDEIIPEPLGGAHRDAAGVIARVFDRIDGAIGNLTAYSGEQLIAARYEKYRTIGSWQRDRAASVAQAP
jgi:acetyl-CoA carboxylase carboxyl transferase subunit alpha